MSEAILVIDSEQQFRRDLKRILQIEGYVADTAASGADAFARIRGKRYAAVLLDLHLPDLNGSEIIQFLNVNDPTCSVIALTGQASVESAVQAIRFGCYDYLIKPCQPEQVGLTIKRAVEHQSLKKELYSSINKYQRLAEATWEAIAIFSEDGISEVNQQFCDLFGTGEQEAVRRGLNDFIPDLTIPVPAQYIQNLKHRQAVETRALRQNGVFFPVEVRLKSIFDNGRPLWVVAVRDITKRQQEEQVRNKLEERLTYAMRMESIGLMAGSVAHDLNNILSSIVTFPELLLLQMPAKAKYRKDIERIKRAGQQAAAVVTDLLTIARGSTCKKKIRNLNSILLEYKRSLDFQDQIKSLPDITIKMDLDRHLKNTRVSPTHVTNCLINLVRNGVEAIEVSGNITIKTANRFLTETLYSYENIPPGHYATIIVTDTGKGIAASDIPHIFEPFYSRKKMGRSGTGLGLTVIMHTMRDHCGFIDIRSGENGTVFELFFPAARQKQPFERAPASLDLLQGKGEKILIVDDEESQRSITAAILNKLGYTTCTAENGEQAIQFIKNNPVDLLLLDMIMDPGMNGYETFKEIRQIIPNQKAVVASGFHNHPDREKLKALGISHYLPKPLNVTHLALAIREEINTCGI
ncbi:MAG: response regulator [Desulforhopalus sp.]